MVRLEVPDRFVGSEGAAGIANVVEEAPGEILTDRPAEVRADSPDCDSALGLAPACEGKPLEEDEAPPSLELGRRRGEERARAGKGKVGAAEREEVDSAIRDRAHRGLELRDHGVVQVEDPVGPRRHPVAAPRGRIVEDGGQPFAHGAPLAGADPDLAERLGPVSRVEREAGRDPAGGISEAARDRTVRVLGDGGPAFVRVGADLRGEGKLAEEGHAVVDGHLLASAGAEDGLLPAASGAHEDAHVLDDAEHRDLDPFEHLETLAGVGEGHVLGSGDDDRRRHTGTRWERVS